MKSAIFIGASSGIGRALPVTLSLDGYRVGVVARRTDLLAQLRAELAGPCVIKTVDVSQPDLAMPLLRELIEELGDVELFVVTDVQPGFVDTRMAAGNRLWIASPQKAARQIVGAIRGRKQRVYITRRWRLIAWLLRVVPDALYSKL